MKFSKKVNYALYSFLIVLNIYFRYMFLTHEVGVDSFQIHSYANSITGFGYATWIIHPYSFLGLTPDSYPSAVPFILSCISQCMNLSTELSILLLSFIIIILGLFGSILLAKQIKNDDLFIFLVAFLFSTSPIFLRFTIWTASTRSLFIGILPIFLWSLLRCRITKEINWKYLGLSIILFIILLSTHRMGLLLFLFVFAFITTIIIFNFYMKVEFNNVIKKVAYILWFLILIIFFYFQLTNLGIYKEIGMGAGYQEGLFFQGQNPGVIFANMTIDYVSRTGILSIFGLIGFSIIFIKRNKSNSIIKIKKNFNEILIILVLLFLSSALFLGLYTSLVILPIFVIVISGGILWSIRLFKSNNWIKFTKIKNLISIIFIIILLTISIYFTYFMNQHWLKPYSDTQESKWLEDETIDTAFYIDDYNNNYNFRSNSQLINARIVALQKEPIDYEIDLETVSIEKGGLLDLLRSDTLYVKQEDESKYIFNIPSKEIDEPSTEDYLNQNRLKFIIEKKSIFGRTIQYFHSGTQESKFLESMHEQRYKVYENDLEIIWYI